MPTFKLAKAQMQFERLVKLACSGQEVIILSESNNPMLLEPLKIEKPTKRVRARLQAAGRDPRGTRK